jgi:hypothetical protein
MAASVSLTDPVEGGVLHKVRRARDRRQNRSQKKWPVDDPKVPCEFSGCSRYPDAKSVSQTKA